MAAGAAAHNLLAVSGYKSKSEALLRDVLDRNQLDEVEVFEV